MRMRSIMFIVMLSCSHFYVILFLHRYHIIIIHDFTSNCTVELFPNRAIMTMCVHSSYSIASSLPANMRQRCTRVYQYAPQKIIKIKKDSRDTHMSPVLISQASFSLSSFETKILPPSRGNNDCRE